ncbi:hypothetical protein JX266_013651 [Neoarthrinium moseri]|nr:hypothetical protein JX266_013651 [Neoarthrinium moseri]
MDPLAEAAAGDLPHRVLRKLPPEGVQLVAREREPEPGRLVRLGVGVHLEEPAEARPVLVEDAAVRETPGQGFRLARLDIVGKTRGSCMTDSNAPMQTSLLNHERTWQDSPATSPRSGHQTQRHAPVVM